MRKPVEDLPPAVVDGALVRLVEEAGMTYVEQWMGAARGWELTTSTWSTKCCVGLRPVQRRSASSATR